MTEETNDNNRDLAIKIIQELLDLGCLKADKTDPSFNPEHPWNFEAQDVVHEIINNHAKKIQDLQKKESPC